ncbi:FecR family protein [Novosphingobium sp. TCA1]|uniref:FecR family protein n=1 Tax=Novosphingobium sp. TCA1 TaxID=2682474 RepID=UPI001055AD92|nr:FecR domain-containing protein [Novosphingobium sp. TCA1]GFE77759.1 iron dicitrate transporter FecR [Novosphingobium sp. TCA1]
MIDEIASQWAAAMDRGLAADERVRLDEWLAQDRRHKGALLRARAAMSVLDRCRILAGIEDGRAPDGNALANDDHALPAWAMPFARRRFLALGGTGIAAALTAALTFTLWPRGTTLGTDTGEIRRIPLADGSLAVINSGSELHVAFSDRSRDVQLTKGEAWFQVAKMPDRPFTVTAGSVNVQAVGTAFSVRRRSEATEVVVTEGTVKVWSTQAPEGTFVTAGHSVRINDAGVAVAALDGEAAERQLAWRDGRIVFEDVPLSQAAAEFNGYHNQQIAVDPSFADKRVVGSFQTDDINGFASASAAMVGGRVIHDNNVIRIVP